MSFVLVPQERLQKMFAAARRIAKDERDPESRVLGFLGEWLGDVDHMQIQNGKDTTGTTGS